MAKFILKIGDETVELSAIKDRALKRSFEELKSGLESLLGTTTCPVHHREPKLLLRNHGSQAVVGGFGSCCGEFNSQVKALLAQHAYPVEQWTSTTVIKHTTM